MPGFTGFVLSVVGDIPVDSETLVMPSSVSSRGFVGPVFEGAHMGSVCVREFIGVSLRAL
jgi:hypothetical protein